jgi:hypothetical protein
MTKSFPNNQNHEKLSHMEVNKKDMILNVMWYPGLDGGTERNLLMYN